MIIYIYIYRCAVYTMPKSNQGTNLILSTSGLFGTAAVARLKKHARHRRVERNMRKYCEHIYAFVYVTISCIQYTF